MLHVVVQFYCLVFTNHLFVTLDQIVMEIVWETQVDKKTVFRCNDGKTSKQITCMRKMVEELYLAACDN